MSEEKNNNRDAIDAKIYVNFKIMILQIASSMFTNMWVTTAFLQKKNISQWKECTYINRPTDKYKVFFFNLVPHTSNDNLK